MRKYIVIIVKYIAGVIALGALWGIAEGLINRFWPPVGVWRPDLLLTSVYRRVWFYTGLAAALALLWAAGRGGWWLVRGRRAKRPRLWGPAVATALVVVVNVGWLGLALVKGQYLRLGPLTVNLFDRNGFNQYWAACAVFTVGAAVALGLAAGRRRWFAVGSRYATVVGAAAFVAVFAGYHVKQALRPKPQGPNVILLVFDAWRADAFRSQIMPHTHAFARDYALDFERTWTTATWTIPAMASMFTGQYSDTNQTRQLPNADVVCPTVAQALRDAGYDTSALVANRILDRNHTITDGFEEYRFSDWPAWLVWTNFPHTNWYGPAIRGLMHKDADAEDSFRLTEMIVSYVSRPHDRPYFLWAHYMDPHAPYVPPEGYYSPADRCFREDFNQYDRKRRFANLRLYLGECRYLDDLMAQLLPYLISDRRTIVIITGDHGEEFWEHNEYTFGHGKSVYDSLMRVPLIMHVPGTTPAVVQQPTTTLDLAPTIMALCGMQPLPTMQGKPFLSPAGDVIPRSEPIIMGSSFFKVEKNKPERQDAIVLWPHKLLLYYDKDGRPAEYYDLAQDPFERQPLPEDDKAREMRGLLRAWKKRVIIEQAGVEGSGVPPTELRALGYIK